MKYTLITKLGRVYTFHTQALANIYQGAYGGVVLTQQILESVDTPAQKAV
jgi:hypothetical protein